MRELSNWLDSYVTYVDNTESAKIFHKWTALAVIAAVLRKKIKLNLGRINVYPNMYVVLVGPPGGPRKSQAITFGMDFLREIPDIVLSADAITPQALIQDLESSAMDEVLPNGEKLEHASLTAVSKELESFLGQRGENTKMIITLTDLFDANELPWKYRTKHYGTNVIPSVFLNLFAATTPDSIGSSFPLNAIGGGLSSRIVFVWAEKREKKVTVPGWTPEELVLKEKLHKDLFTISRMAGTYKYTSESFKFWDNWYHSYEAQSTSRICRDNLFNGWYERKPLYVQKLSIIHAAATTSKLLLEIPHIESALNVLAETEVEMSNVFRAMGRSTIAADVDVVGNIIQGRKWITEEQLTSLIWRDIDALKFDNVINTLKKRGHVKRYYEGPEGEKGQVWYKYVGSDFNL